MPLLILPLHRQNSKQKSCSGVIDASAVDIRASSRCLHCGKYPQYSFAEGRWLAILFDLRLFAMHRFWHVCCAQGEESVSSSDNGLERTDNARQDPIIG